MAKILIDSKEYSIPERIYLLINNIYPVDERTVVEGYLKTILEHPNNQKGKISESILLAVVVDRMIGRFQVKWTKLLTSEVFGKGFIKDKQAIKIVEMNHSCNWRKIDEGYKQGTITEEDIKKLMGMVDNCEKDEESLSQCATKLGIIEIILTSEIYKKGQISKNIIDLLYSISDEMSQILKDIVLAILNENNFPQTEVSDELLKLIIAVKSKLIGQIIYNIIITNTIPKDKKKATIEAICTMTQDDINGLESTAKQYVEEKKVSVMEEFAVNFVIMNLALNHIVIGGERTLVHTQSPNQQE